MQSCGLPGDTLYNILVEGIIVCCPVVELDIHCPGGRYSYALSISPVDKTDDTLRSNV